MKREESAINHTTDNTFNMISLVYSQETSLVYQTLHEIKCPYVLLWSSLEWGADTKKHIQIPGSLIREIQACPFVRLQLRLGGRLKDEPSKVQQGGPHHPRRHLLFPFMYGVHMCDKLGRRDFGITLQGLLQWRYLPLVPVVLGILAVRELRVYPVDEK